MSGLFQEWLDQLDPGRRAAAARSPAPWLGAGAVVLVTLATAAWAPGPREFFRLRFGPAFACFVPAFAFATLASWIDGGDRLPRALWGGVELVNATLATFATAAFVAWSRPPGASVMAGLYVVASLHFGRVHRATLRHPWTLLPAPLAAAAALALRPDPDHAQIFAVATPVAVGGAWVVGTQAVRAQQENRRRATLEAALQAQLLEERSRDVARLEGAILRILQTNHEASNTLTTALIHGETLVEETRRLVREGRAAPEVAETAVELADRLGRLRRLVQETRAVGQRRAELLLGREPVDARAAARAAVDELRDRHPGVELCLREGGDAGQRLAPVAVAGGAATLHHIVENLVRNACEGDGARRARRVDVEVRAASGVGAVALSVADDGPGFPQRELEQPVTAGGSNELDETWLRLYTAERLVRASGGSLVRENREGGGRRVTLYLDAAEPADAAGVLPDLPGSARNGGARRR